MSTFENLLDDVHNAVGVVLRQLAPRLAPHLPHTRPQAPHALQISGGGGVGGLYDVVQHPTPVWRGTTRVVVEDSLITIEKRDGDGWTPLWRSDSPNIPLRPDEIEARRNVR
jgi:hypothetical protein